MIGSPQSPSETNQICGLDAFRFFAFFAVFLFHTELFGCGYLGVQAFFVLSGFLLTPILLEMHRKLDTKSYLGVFYGRRILRIFPLYYGYLGILGLAIFLVPTLFPAPQLFLTQLKIQFPYALTYTYDFFHATTGFKHNFFLTHFWSLAVEEQFYLAWPFVLLVTPRPNLKKILFMILLLGPFVRLGIDWVVGFQLLPNLSRNGDLVIYVLPFSHIDAFATGGLFACFVNQVNGKMAWAGLVATLCLGMGSNFWETGHWAFFSLGYPEYMQGFLKFFWGYTAWNLTFALILSALRTNQFLPAVFNHSVFQSLGKISYGLYVYHFPILWLLKNLSLPKAVFWMVSLTTTITVSHLSYVYFEKPFLKLKDRIFPRTVVADPAVAKRGKHPPQLENNSNPETERADS